MNNADLIVQILKAAGIRHGFGVPSGNVLPLMDAMRTGGIRFVLAAHEGSAAFAADVTGRVTRVGSPYYGTKHQGVAGRPPSPHPPAPSLIVAHHDPLSYISAAGFLQKS